MTPERTPVTFLGPVKCAGCSDCVPPVLDVQKPRLLDLFCGAGWDIAARELGLDPLGIDFDADVIATRDAAGMRSVHADISALDPLDYGPVDLLIASPPCQAWSMAGKRQGQEDIERVYALTDVIAADLRGVEMADAFVSRATDVQWADERSPLVTEPLRWALALKPRLIAWEQVPPVLDYWKHCAAILREQGYSAWAGVLSAERYGVPQTRSRAFLIASLNGPVHPPHPTHQRYVKGQPQRHEQTLEGEVLPWVSMAEALGWVGADRPAPTVTAGGGDAGGVEVFGRGGREAIKAFRIAVGALTSATPFIGWEPTDPDKITAPMHAAIEKGNDVLGRFGPNGEADTRRLVGDKRDDFDPNHPFEPAADREGEGDAGERWTLCVCPDCGWTILDENAADPQPCEAGAIDGELDCDGICERVTVAPVTDEPPTDEAALDWKASSDLHATRAQSALDGLLRISQGALPSGVYRPGEHGDGAGNCVDYIRHIRSFASDCYRSALAVDSAGQGEEKD